jgi:hypothetical protein
MVLVISALALGVSGCVNPAQVAQQRQALAAQQQAQFQRGLEIWLASSPEGTSQQWQSDVSSRNALTDLQKDALKDQDLGVPPIADEQLALTSMTQEQKRSLARLNLMDAWLKQQAIEMQQQAQWQQAMQVQANQAQAQREQAQMLCYQQMRTGGNGLFNPALAAEACSRY